MYFIYLYRLQLLFFKCTHSYSHATVFSHATHSTSRDVVNQYPPLLDDRGTPAPAPAPALVPVSAAMRDSRASLRDMPASGARGASSMDSRWCAYVDRLGGTAAVPAAPTPAPPAAA